MEDDRDYAERAAGRNLVRAMTAAGVKPGELARKMEVTPQTVTNWRTRGVASTHGVAVAELLRVDPKKISRVEGSGRLVAEHAAVYGHATVTPRQPKEVREAGGRPLEGVLGALVQAGLSDEDLALIRALVERLGRTR